MYERIIIIVKEIVETSFNEDDKNKRINDAILRFRFGDQMYNILETQTLEIDMKNADKILNYIIDAILSRLQYHNMYMSKRIQEMTKSNIISNLPDTFDEQFVYILKVSDLIVDKDTFILSTFLENLRNIENEPVQNLPLLPDRTENRAEQIVSNLLRYAL